MQRAGKDVEWHYYEGGRHGLIADPANIVRRESGDIQQFVDGVDTAVGEIGKTRHANGCDVIVFGK